MHVELIYSPDCNDVQSTLQVLETIIAEERLPIPVEVTKGRPRKDGNDLMIKVDGKDVNDFHQGKNCECCNQHRQRTGLKKALCMEHLRDVLWHNWKELTEHSLLAVRRR